MSGIMGGTVVRKATAEPRWLRWALTGVGLGFLFFFLALSLVAVFSEALAGGGTCPGSPDVKATQWLSLGTVVLVVMLGLYKIASSLLL